MEEFIFRVFAGCALYAAFCISAAFVFFLYCGGKSDE